MKTITYILMAAALSAAISCNKYELQNIDPNRAAGQQKADISKNITDGRSDLNLPVLEPVRAYYDNHAFNVQLTQLIDGSVTYEPPRKIDAAVLYVYDQDSHSGITVKKGFYPVCSDMADAGQSLLYNKVVIYFMPGCPKRQFYSDREVLLASEGIHPTIILMPTENYYTGRLYNIAKEPNPLVPR